MMKAAVLVSGGGTNLQAIIDSIREGTITDVQISLVLSNNKNAYALERAKAAGIPARAISPKDYGTRQQFNDALLSAVQESGAQLVVLAGFLCVIPPEMVEAYPNRIINIHPALIPSFCGKGMYGIRPHEAALARGVKVSGATVHLVNENYDEGPILLQKCVDILPDDTPEVLQKRIMKECEQVILPKAISLFAEGKVEIKNKIAYVKE